MKLETEFTLFTEDCTILPPIGTYSFHFFAYIGTRPRPVGLSPTKSNLQNCALIGNGELGAILGG